ncbi:carboxylesterase family protein [Sphingobium sp. H39-3-25]|uniref:carboxylesterase/lipase family protein n=1 Tax=Sphingobium arseniciresistens TaxID=3030834 RepID=UPI0023B999AB|nr:carboxylesterase family protein [Sphingobium arseniciresistens]
MSVTAGIGSAHGADDIVAPTLQGKVRGGSADGVEYFMGIPYAAPPVGDLRWREPQMPASWVDVRDATKPGAICPQVVRPGSTEPAPSEDCLFINIWRPAGAKAGAKLPVMLWYHGGGMVFGSGSSTDGRYFAQKGVILVTLNYRLGHLGTFAHPALTAESPNGLTGNYTLMDSVAALKWVRSNIAGFGGDPQNVTIFGFSAGAQIVNTLMVTPSARGLFAKAITQSGLGRNYGHQGQNRILPIRGPATETGEKAGLAVAASLGVQGTGPDALKALRAIPPEQFKLAPTSLPGSMIDGVLLPEPVATAYRNGHEAPVPQIIGRTICERCGVESIIKNPEATFVRAKALRDRVVALYGSESPNTAVEFASDLDHVEPARYLSRFHAHNGRATWNYVFNYTTPSKRGEQSGPAHGDDIPYIFGTLRSPAGRRFDPTAADIEMSDAMLTYWTNFAKTSNPGTAHGLRWTPFGGPQQETVMVFTNEGPKLDSNFKKERLDLAEQVNDAIQSQSYVAQ